MIRRAAPWDVGDRLGVTTHPPEETSRRGPARMREMTHAEIGSAMGLSWQRVQQIEQEALRKLRGFPGEVLRQFLLEMPCRAESVSERCEEHADAMSRREWREITLHLRRRFRELGWR